MGASEKRGSVLAVEKEGGKGQSFMEVQKLLQMFGERTKWWECTKSTCEMEDFHRPAEAKQN